MNNTKIDSVEIYYLLKDISTMTNLILKTKDKKNKDEIAHAIYNMVEPRQTELKAFLIANLK